MECRERGEECVFAVHNPDVMPEAVQLQVFQRSFSTKEPSGRGIGTYSMKLFGERYLGGKVDFVSREPEGTTFTLALRKRPAENTRPA
jgi:sensor histidine kinase regulating citrate/malate metabolism